MSGTAEYIYQRARDIGMDKMRLIVFRNALRKGISEEDAAQIAEIAPEDIARYREKLNSLRENKEPL